MHVVVQTVLLVLILPLGLSLVAGDGLRFYIIESGEAEVVFLRIIVHIFISARISFLTAQPIKNIGPICFYIFVYLWIITVPSMQMYYDDWPWRIILTQEIHIYIFIIVIISILSFESGWNLSYNKKHYYNKNYIIIPNENIIYILFIAYLFIFIFFIVNIGDLSLLFGARVNAYQNVVGSSTARLVANALFRTPIVAISLVLFSLYLSGLHRRYRFFWGLAIACLIMLTISNFPTAQTRAGIGSVIIAFIAVWFIYRRPRLANWFPTVMAGGMLIAFPLLGQTRRNVDLDSLNWEGVRNAYFQGSFDAYQMLGVIVDYTNTYGVVWGRQFLGALFFWVPRSIWPDKPIGSGAQVGTDLGMSFTNISAPLWAEAYLNFGMLGVLAVFFILGWVLRTISTAFLDRGGMMMIFGSFFVGFQLFLLRGDLMSSFTFLTPFLVFAILIFWRSRHVSLLPSAAHAFPAGRNAGHSWT